MTTEAPQLPTDQVPSTEDKSSLACSTHERSPPSEPTHVTPEIPVLSCDTLELPVSLTSSPPPETRSVLSAEQEPEFHPSNEPEQGALLSSLSIPDQQPESEISSPVVPPSEANVPSVTSSGTEAVQVEERSEIESDEKLVESTVSSGEAMEVCCTTETSSGTLARGMNLDNILMGL